MHLALMALDNHMSVTYLPWIGSQAGKTCGLLHHELAVVIVLQEQVQQISLIAGQQSHKRWLCRAKSDKVEQLKQENEALQADIHQADLEIEELSQNLQVRQ